jgi:hypothetical protein
MLHEPDETNVSAGITSISQYIEAHQITSGQPLLPSADTNHFRRCGSDLINIKELDNGEDALLELSQDLSVERAADHLTFFGPSSINSFIKQILDSQGTPVGDNRLFLDNLNPAGGWELYAVSERTNGPPLNLI